MAQGELQADNVSSAGDVLLFQMRNHLVCLMGAFAQAGKQVGILLGVVQLRGLFKVKNHFLTQPEVRRRQPLAHFADQVSQSMHNGCQRPLLVADDRQSRVQHDFRVAG